MLPTNSRVLNAEIRTGVIPSKNYRMDIKRETVNGDCDGTEAMKQVIYKILNTERYEHIIYPWFYGIELSDLVGQPDPYVFSEVERRICEALTQDNRIMTCSDFEFEKTNKKSLHVSFRVKTKFGSMDSETEVTI
ncbi:MAG: DUF2634 domain-containing protein [Oscillospiraceae bacterium]